MLLAALGFSVMGGAAKALKGSFGAGQLVFYRNLVGLLFLMPGLWVRPPVQPGGKPGRLVFRGLMGTCALYTLLYCILHLPLGTAMSYNLTSALFIAIFSFLFFREFGGLPVLVAVVLGFSGILLIYKPVMNLGWYYHVAGLVSGITSAIAYLTVHRLTRYYDPRIIVLSFLVGGVLFPVAGMMAHYIWRVPADGFWVLRFVIPTGVEWLWVVVLGLAALFGQYFVTLAYGADKAGVVSVFGYANIVYSVLIGVLLGDAFPDGWSWSGMVLIVLSGVVIVLSKKKSRELQVDIK
jgi:drug/metabolite transporter (DMT)-like permease